MIASPLEPSCSSAWRYVKSVAVQADIDNAARCEAEPLSHRFRNNDPPHIVDLRFHREDTTNTLPVDRYRHDGEFERAWKTSAMDRPEPDHAHAMRRALQEAVAAEMHGDVPVGAVVVRHGEIIAARHNERELTGDPTAHAEVLALRDAAVAVGHWRLDDCTLYVTLEPCAMCAGAIVNGRVAAVVYGADDPKAGAVRSLFEIADDPRLNHRAAVERGVLADESAALLKAFFASRRGRSAVPAADEPAEPA